MARETPRPKACRFTRPMPWAVFRPSSPPGYAGSGRLCERDPSTAVYGRAAHSGEGEAPSEPALIYRRVFEPMDHRAPPWGPRHHTRCSEDSKTRHRNKAGSGGASPSRKHAGAKHKMMSGGAGMRNAGENRSSRRPSSPPGQAGWGRLCKPEPSRFRPSPPGETGYGPLSRRDPSNPNTRPIGAPIRTADRPGSGASDSRTNRDRISRLGSASCR